MMPGIDGFEFTRAVRELNEEIPILFMTARDDLASKQRGFRAGIDDYMVKPVDLDELLLRVEALLRRAHIASSKRLVIGALTLDAEEHSAYLNKEEIGLTVREFNLIYKLLSYPKKTFTRSQLMDEFLGQFDFSRIMIASSVAVIFLFIVGMGISMMVRARRRGLECRKEG